MRYLGNAFSAGMLEDSCTVLFRFLDLGQVKTWL